jgi:hypothetical protein
MSHKKSHKTRKFSAIASVHSPDIKTAVSGNFAIATSDHSGLVVFASTTKEAESLHKYFQPLCCKK